MKYAIKHSTSYQYSQVVGQCHSLAHMRPRDLPGQSCISYSLSVNPHHREMLEYQDYFGNHVNYFTVQQSHRQFQVVAECEVNIDEQLNNPDPVDSEDWQSVREKISSGFMVQGLTSEQILQARLFSMDSGLVGGGEAIRQFAADAFLPGQGVYETAMNLTGKIFQEFDYDPGFTSIVTPLATVLEHKRGVCQDFAHLAIACFRSYGLPARYVSGYLETVPPEGQEKLAGSDATHAWFSVLIPGYGWMDFDPTNNCKTSNQHITLAWGRDFIDVTPLKGLAVGGSNHQVMVAVDVLRQ